MNAAASPYRPQLGVIPSASNNNERDDRNRNQPYIESITSPLSPSTSSDFSFSKYQSDTNGQQRSMGYNTETPLASSGSNPSMISQRSSGSNNGPRDSIVLEHYVALKKYLTRHLAVEGIFFPKNF